MADEQFDPLDAVRAAVQVLIVAVTMAFVIVATAALVLGTIKALTVVWDWLALP